jgi:WD40 repeat protein
MKRELLILSFCLACAFVPSSVLAQSAAKIELVASTGQEAVWSAAFSSEGKLLLVGYKEGVARLWDVASQRQIRQFSGRDGSVDAVAFAPDGSSILTASDNIARLWDFSTGRELQKFNLKCPILSASFRAHGPVALVACGVSNPFLGAAARSWRLGLWDLSSNREVFSVNRGASPGPVALSPDGLHALFADPDPSHPISGNRDYAVLMDLNTGSELFRLKHGQSVDAVAFSPDGTLALTGSQDQTACVWNVSTGQTVQCFSESERIRSVAFSGREQVLTVTNRAADVWSVASGKKLRSADLSGNLVITSFDGQQVFVGDGRGPAALFDVQKTQAIRHVSGNSSRTESMTVSPDGRFLVTESSDKYNICCTAAALWDFKAGAEVGRLTADVKDTALFDSDSTLTRGAGFIDGDAIVLATTIDGAAELINVATRETIKPPSGIARCTLGPKQIQFSVSGGSALVEPECSNAELWDLKKHSITRKIKPTRHPALTLSPQGDLMILRLETGDGDWGVVQFPNGKPRRLGDSDSQPDFAVFSGDEHRLLTAKYDAAEVWDIAKGSAIQSLKSEDVNITSLAFSQDGSIALTGGTDGIARLWDVQTGKVLSAYDCGPGEVLSTAFSPRQSSSSGQPAFALTGCPDGTVKMWEAKANGRLLCSLVSFVAGGWAVIAPDGRFDTNRFEMGPTVSWVYTEEPLRPLPIEVFTKDYYTPNLLRDLLDGHSLPQVSPAQLNRTQPGVRIVSVDPEAGTLDQVTVRVEVSSRKSPAQKDANGQPLDSGAYDLRLFRDGRLIPQTAPLPVPLPLSGAGGNDVQKWREQNRIIDTGETIVPIQHVHLPQRDGVESTVFTAYAFNADRVKSETSSPFPYPVQLPSRTRQPRTYLITMGVNTVNASQPVWDLAFAVPSAEKMAGLWKRRLSNLNTVAIMLTSDKNDKGEIKPGATATKTALGAVFDILAGRGASVPSELRKAIDPGNKLGPATPDDDVVLYVASHGFVDPRSHEFYMIPFDSRVLPAVDENLLTECESQNEQSNKCSKARAFLEQSISSDDLNRWWHGVDANNMILIVDSCYSAAVIGTARPAPLGDRTFGQLSFDKGIQILAATQAETRAQGLAANGSGHTLLVDALEKVWAWKTPPYEEKAPLLSRNAPPVVIEVSGVPISIPDWFRGAVRQLPLVYRQLRPDLKFDDLQAPVFLDFAPLATKPQ